MCDDFTEPEVASSTVCDHYPELCDVTEYVHVVSSAADGADPFVLSDPPECNDLSVWEHNPPELCDVTQFEVATTPEVDTTVRDRVTNKIASIKNIKILFESTLMKLQNTMLTG